MNNYWVTKDHQIITFAQLTDSHLLHILRYIERKAEDGLIIGSRGGSAEDAWGDVLEEDEVKEYLDYDELKNEAIKRGLLR